MVCSVNDIPLVSMVKDTDEPTVRSDGLCNKYDPDNRLLVSRFQSYLRGLLSFCLILFN